MPVIPSYASSLLKRAAVASPSPDNVPSTPDIISRTLTARDTVGTVDPSSGVTPFDSVPSKFVFILIGLIGAGFVITGIWFFFIAKNGGFVFHENDWDDYKSTVLRRKGPNGTTLSGGSEATDLGGGSIVHGEKKRSTWGRKNKKSKKGGSGMERSRYKDFDEEESTVGTQSELTYSEMSEVNYPRKEKKNKKSRLRGGDLGDLPESEYGDDMGDLRSYRHEKAARVGGMNQESESSMWEGSTNHEGSTVSDGLMQHRERTPETTPEKPKKSNNKDHYKIRKVVGTVQGPRASPTTKDNGGSSSFWNRQGTTKKSSRQSEADSSVTDDERVKAEAQKLQDKGRAAQRRDFSFRVGDDNSSAAGSSLISARDAAAAREQERREREARRARREARKQGRSNSHLAPLPPPAYSAAESSVGGSELSSVREDSEVSGDTGHKSYPCFIPGLSSERGGNETDYTEDRRKKRNGGYRRE